MTNPALKCKNLSSNCVILNNIQICSYHIPLCTTVLPFATSRPLRFHLECLTPTCFLRRLRRLLMEIVVALGILTALAGIGWGTMQEYLPRFRLLRIGEALSLRSPFLCGKYCADQS